MKMMALQLLQMTMLMAFSGQAMSSQYLPEP